MFGFNREIVLICSNFMVGVPYFNTKTEEYGWGLQGELQSVPMGFVYETSIFYGQGIRRVRTKKKLKLQPKIFAKSQSKIDSHYT